MVREDIVAGLRNALARGISIEEAIKSFINAGYNAIEVEEAAKVFGGVSNIVNIPRNSEENSFVQQPVSQVQTQQAQGINKLSEVRPTPGELVNKPRRSMGIIITLVVILLLLVGGLVWAILFGQDLLDKVLG